MGDARTGLGFRCGANVLRARVEVIELPAAVARVVRRSLGLGGCDVFGDIAGALDHGRTFGRSAPEKRQDTREPGRRATVHALDLYDVAARKFPRNAIPSRRMPEAPI